MRAVMKAMLINSRGENEMRMEGGSRNEMAYGRSEAYNRSEMNGAQNAYNRMGGDYEMENRRGRQPRDDRGRYRPKNEYRAEGMYAEGGMRNHYPEEPHMPRGAREEQRKPMNKIGFATGDEVSTDYRSTVDYPRMNEMEHRRSSAMMGHGKSDEDYELTKEIAEEWMENLKNADGSTGGHWTRGQTKILMDQHDINEDPLEFYVALNLIYSDYAKVFRKYGVADKLEFYVDMAKAFIEDEDAIPGKIAAYYECIVKD